MAPTRVGPSARAKSCSCAQWHIRDTVLRSYPLASPQSHVVAGAEPEALESCQSCPAPMHRMARSYAGSPNMKLESERVSALSTTFLLSYTQGASARDSRHIEIVIHSHVRRHGALCELCQTAAVSRCVSKLHENTYRILECRDLCICCQETRPHMPWRRTDRGQR